MSNKTNLNVNAFVGIGMMAIVSFILWKIVQTFVVSNIGSDIAGVFVTLGIGALLVVVSFRLIDYVAKGFKPTSPEDLKIAGVEIDIKNIWQSKTFWVALLMLAVQMVNLASGSVIIDEETVTAVTSLDWSNWVQAGGAALIIVLRRYFIGSKVR